MLLTILLVCVSVFIVTLVLGVLWALRVLTTSEFWAFVALAAALSTVTLGSLVFIMEALL